MGRPDELDVAVILYFDQLVIIQCELVSGELVVELGIVAATDEEMVDRAQVGNLDFYFVKLRPFMI